VNGLSHNSVILQGKLNDTAKEYQAAQGFLAEKFALVTRLETALNDANKSISKMQANLKDREEEIISLQNERDDALANYSAVMSEKGNDKKSQA
jgi:chromosome segregation ATPase